MDSQAEAVLLGDVQHFPPQILAGLGEYDGAGESDGPLVLPLNLILKLKLGADRRDNESAGGAFAFCGSVSELSSATDLQDDPDGLSVAVIQGR